MLGQGILPRGHDPRVDVMPDADMRDRLARVRDVVRKSVDTMPAHFDYIARHCAAPPIP